MSRQVETQPNPPGLTSAAAWRALLVLAGALTVLRLAALFLTPLELYPDEAQYWLWSRTLDWGYVSKPPMIAWLIAATTRIGGDGEPWVRLAAPLIHVGAMLALFPVGRRLYGPTVGLVAAALYGLMPAVQVSALFIATDAPLMLFLALALWAYVALLQTVRSRDRARMAAGVGLCIGLAFLAKQAAIYFLLGVALHMLIDPSARRVWRGWAWVAALAALALALAPNLAWQATHGFATFAHTAQVNAGWDPGQLFHPGKLAEFLIGQLGVMGPIPFAVLLIGSVALARRKTLASPDRMLLCFALPPLVLVSIQALISHAHAHWAAAGYLAGVVLVAAWLERWRARGWSIAAVATQGAVAALLLLAVCLPSIVDSAGFGRRLARQRGWSQTAVIVTGAASASRPTAVAVEDRYLFNELAYYGRGYFNDAGAAPLRMRPAPVQALNEAELSAPLQPAETGRVLIAETAGLPTSPRLPGDFSTIQPLAGRTIALGGRKTRQVQLWLGTGYRVPTTAYPSP